MRTAVSTYGFINAKLRGRISKLLDESFYRAIARARTFVEAVNLLAGTAYEQALAVYTSTGDVKLLELELIRIERESLAGLDRYIPSEIRAFTRAVIRQYQVATLKHALRLWFDHTVRQRSIDDKVPYLLRGGPAGKSPAGELPVDEIVNASNRDEVLAALSDTEYEEILESRLPAAGEAGTLFLVEVALDTWYFSHLREQALTLRQADQAVALRLIGLQIDLQNVNWVVRMKHYHNLDERQLTASLLRGGALIDVEELRRARRAEQPIDVLVGALGPRYSALVSRAGSEAGADQVRRLSILEDILRSVMHHEIHRTLGSYPFTIGSMLAYFLLTQQEVRTLTGVINARYYDLEPERIEALL